LGGITELTNLKKSIFPIKHDFSKLFILKRFRSILPLKKCWANRPDIAGERVKLSKD
jgi:hypothetical protein